MKKSESKAPTRKLTNKSKKDEIIKKKDMEIRELRSQLMLKDLEIESLKA